MFLILFIVKFVQHFFSDNQLLKQDKFAIKVFIYNYNCLIPPSTIFYIIFTKF